MTIASDNGTSDVLLQSDGPKGRLERAREAIREGDHANARRLCEEIIGMVPDESDPLRAEAELLLIESVILRGHTYSAYELFVMGDIYYLTPEVRQEILPHYRIYRRACPGAKSIEDIIEGLGRSYDVNELFAYMRDKENKHDLMQAASDIQYLRKLIDKMYSPDKDFQKTGFNLYLYLVTNVHRPETRNLMLENYDNLFNVIPRSLRTCLLEREVNGRV